jgi:hypothetical protein
MTPAAYISRLVRPDLAGFREERARGLFARIVWGSRDARLRQLFAHAPYPASSAEWFAETALEWVYDSVKAEYQGRTDFPQTARTTLESLRGDCEDGAILLGCMIVSGLVPEAWGLARFCVGSVDDQRNHAFLEWRRLDLGETVLLDWTLETRPICRDEVEWEVESSVVLG